MTTRRSFLSLLGGAAVAGPSALSATAERVASVPLADWAAPPTGGMPMASAGTSAPNLTVAGAKLLGVPDWLRDTWKHEAKHVHILDPDIAALKSMSLSAKIAMQRKRNYEQREADFWRRFEVDELRINFMSKHGYFNWW